MNSKVNLALNRITPIISDDNIYSFATILLLRKLLNPVPLNFYSDSIKTV